jgi:deoxycytidylate deaminase
MKTKHLRARIAYCLAMAECSTCVRRKFGAVIFDPVTNTDISAGYNGPPRGGPDKGLCSGTASFCTRNGYRPEDLAVTDHRGTPADQPRPQGHRTGEDDDDAYLWHVPTRLPLPFIDDRRITRYNSWRHVVEAAREALLRDYPPIASGERTEVGCHHAEANAIANAARRGTPLEGAAIVVTGEPCLSCAKLIHHVGIVEVFCVKGGYAGGGAGVKYLQQNKVDVTLVDGPADPRSLPLFKATTVKYGLPNPIGDDTGTEQKYSTEGG